MKIAWLRWWLADWLRPNEIKELRAENERLRSVIDDAFAMAARREQVVQAFPEDDVKLLWDALRAVVRIVDSEHEELRDSVIRTSLLRLQEFPAPDNWKVPTA